MRRESAERAIRQWVRSKFFKAALSDGEYDVLLTSLMGSPSGMTSPSIVNDILKRLYPQHENFTGTGEQNMSTNRVVPRLESRAAASQTIDEIKREVDRYVASGHWEACASEFVKPRSDSGIGSEQNLKLVASAIKDFIATGKRLRSTDICDIVMRLVSENPSRLERVPTVRVVETPKPVEPASEPTERELYNRQVRIDRAMNQRNTHPVRGAKEEAKPLLKPVTNTNIAEQLASEKAAEENSIVREAQRLISVYQGSSHSRTYSGRAHLQSVLTTALVEGVEAKEILARVQQAADKLQDSGSIR